MTRIYCWFPLPLLLIIGGVLLLAPPPLKAQLKDSAYHAMLETLYSKTVPLLPVDSFRKIQRNVVVLDTRQKEEYNVSHLQNAKWVGYEAFQKSRVSDYPKDTPIIVHCAVGYRSEKIGEQLQKMGFTSVENLYGGIFEWMNRGYPVYKNDSTRTNEIHPYSPEWGVWLNRGEKVYE